jgi:HEPN domain-containing protein
LEQGGISLPEDIRLAAALSDYAVEARYPGPMEPVTEEEYQQAIILAETVIRWVEQLIRTDEGGKI